MHAGLSEAVGGTRRASSEHPAAASLERRRREEQVDEGEGRASCRAGGGMRQGDGDEETSPRLSELNELLRQLVADEGDHPTSIPSLWLMRHSSSGMNRGGGLSPAVCFTAQGRAELLLG